MTEPCYRVRRQGVVWSDTARDAVVLDLEQSAFFGINATGVQLWRLLLDGANRTELVARLRAVGAPAERAAADTDAFLHALAADGLVEDVPR